MNRRQRAVMAVVAGAWFFILGAGVTGFFFGGWGVARGLPSALVAMEWTAGMLGIFGLFFLGLAGIVAAWAWVDRGKQ